MNNLAYVLRRVSPGGHSTRPLQVHRREVFVVPVEAFDVGISPRVSQLLVDLTVALLVVAVTTISLLSAALATHVQSFNSLLIKLF